MRELSLKRKICHAIKYFYGHHVYDFRDLRIEYSAYHGWNRFFTYRYLCQNMTEIIFISIAAFLISILTFFSGFGLGTILTPVFMIFFPVEIAIALTGVV